MNVYVHADLIARRGFTQADMLTIRPNAIVAHDLWAGSGWGPWTCGWAT